jgi:hypothetical protein
MNRSTVLRSVSIFTGAAAVSLILGTVAFLQVDEHKNSKGDMCTIGSGLKLCARSYKVVSNGIEEIVLDISLTNVGSQRIVVDRGDSAQSLALKNGKGESLLTKHQQKLKSRTSDEDLQNTLASSFVSRRPDPFEFDPGEIIKEKIKLGELYDITLAGKYFVDVTKKINSPSGEGFILLILEKVEIEVEEN